MFKMNIKLKYICPITMRISFGEEMNSILVNTTPGGNPYGPGEGGAKKSIPSAWTNLNWESGESTEADTESPESVGANAFKQSFPWDD